MTTNLRFASILTIATLAGCATADQVKALEEKVAALEETVADLQKSGVRSTGGADSATETKAKALYEKVTDLVKNGDYSSAKKQMAILSKDYSTTQTFKRARKLSAELEVIGKDAPSSWNIEKWYQGESDVTLDGSGTTLLVFWEVWCPHCKREVPKVMETYAKFKSDGLNVVGLTKVTRSSSDEKVTEFISETALNYPVAKEGGDISKHFNVSGIPAAAVVKDGTIVWRGHPARLDDDMLKGWL